MSPIWKDPQATHSTCRGCAEPQVVDLQRELGCSLHHFPGNFSILHSRFWRVFHHFPSATTSASCPSFVCGLLFPYRTASMSRLSPSSSYLTPVLLCYLLPSPWDFSSPTFRHPLPTTQDPLLLAVCAFLPTRKKDVVLPHTPPSF